MSLEDKILSELGKVAKYKRELIDAEQFAKTTANALRISNSSTSRKTIRKLINENVRVLERHEGIQTLRFVYRWFRTTSWLYSWYNSFMYRNGFSASEYFYQNATYTSTGGRTATVIVPLPKGKRTQYEFLEIEIDWSSNELEAYRY